MIQKFLGFALLLALAFSSCKKDATFTETLTDSKWSVTSSTFDEDGTGPIAATNVQDSCNIDDTFVFKADNTLTVTDNSIKCDPTDPATQTATWTLSADEKTITLIPTAFPIAIVYKIVSFSDSEIKLTGADPFGGTGISYETWTKK
jgi:hypothetical protein